MTEEQEASEQVSDSELVARFFAVGDSPYCVWDWDLDRRNVEYLESLDPDYFTHLTQKPPVSTSSPEDGVS